MTTNGEVELRMAQGGVAISNGVFHQLCDLALAAPERLELLSPRTRDAEVSAYRDKLTEVVVLDHNVHANELNSARRRARCQPADPDDIETTAGGISSPVLADDQRRFRQFRKYLAGKRVCDFGAGYGGFVEACLQAGYHACGVEMGETSIAALRHRFGDRAAINHGLDEFANPFDVITMFHVLEHIEDHLGALERIREALAEGGLLIVEVPHARDYLLSEVGLSAFRDFTLWSEHLILHTRETLQAFLGAAGFSDITVESHQRYGFANHLHWLCHQKPGGHEAFAHLSNPRIEAGYAALLADIDRSDTLIALARK